MVDRLANPVAERGKLAVVAAMSFLWVTPTVVFWGAVFGPLRPHGYPAVDVAPSALGFAAGVLVCLLPLALPAAYFRCWEGGRGVRLYEAVGVPLFRRFATNGDLVNRWARRGDPGYRFVRGRAGVRALLAGTREGERSHLVLLVVGLVTALYAARIGWHGWATWLSVGNLVFNAYPVLLQRYNRCRVECGRLGSRGLE